TPSSPVDDDGPGGRGADPFTAQGDAERTGDLRIVVDAARAAGAEHLVEHASPGARRVGARGYQVRGRAVCSQDRGAAVWLEPDRPYHQIDSQEAAELLGDESENLVGRCVTRHH